MIAREGDAMPSVPRRALAVLALSAIGAAPSPVRVIRVGALEPTAVNGAAGTLLIDPGAPSIVMISTAFAERAQLKPGPFAIGWNFGPSVVRGRTAVARITLGGAPEKKRIGWTEQPYLAGADGSVGPGGLTDEVVRFVLHDTRPGERESVLPLVDGGGLFGGAAGLFGRIMLDGEPVRIRFDLRHPANTTTAGTALTLARVHDGTLATATGKAEIAFGVERPVRLMTLAKPLGIGSLAITAISVRTTDFGNADKIATEARKPDPDEVVVTAKGKRDRSRDRITLGTDTLAACSSITFDKRAKLIRLQCR
jgi:hypothetical protein